MTYSNDRRKETADERGHTMEFTETALARVGVRITDNESLWLQCRRCTQRWPVNLKSGGKLPRHYWRCPNGYNARLGELSA
jgi:hypothetical protein